VEKKAFAVKIFIATQMFDARTEQVACAPDDPMHSVSFFQEQLREVGAILAGDAGNQRCFFIVVHAERDGREHHSTKPYSFTRLNVFSSVAAALWAAPRESTLSRAAHRAAATEKRRFGKRPSLVYIGP
jgi:hypothetical protein